jgi:TolA-binding protein
VLADVQQRCTESLKALDQHDYLVVIGALAGLEDQIRYVTVRLMVLREINEIQKQNHKERRNT